MKCREAKSNMALYLGHDLPDKSQWEEVRRHVSTCVACRVHYKRLKDSMSTLEKSQAEATYEVRSSIWPELSNRLDDQKSRPKLSNKTWLPMASVMVAALLFVAVMLQPAHNSHAPLNTSSKGFFSWDWSPAPAQHPQTEQDEAKEHDEDSKKLESVDL